MSGHHADRDDPERARRAIIRYDDLPLLNPASWAESPKVTDSEQRGLSLPTSLEDRYAKWRATPDGMAVFRWLAQRCTEAVAGGATRLYIDKLIWPCRHELGLSVNNSFRALLVRELIDRHPALTGAFELRQRRAS